MVMVAWFIVVLNPMAALAWLAIIAGAMVIGAIWGRDR